jgi:hypothetical protein
VWYHNLDHTDVTAYAHDYIAGPALLDPQLFAENLVKPNMHLPSLSANATLTRVRVSTVGDVLIDLTFPAQVSEGGLVWLHLSPTCAAQLVSTGYPVHGVDGAGFLGPTRLLFISDQNATVQRR